MDSDVNDYARPLDWKRSPGPRVVARVLSRDTPLNASAALPDPPYPVPGS